MNEATVQKTSESKLLAYTNAQTVYNRINKISPKKLDKHGKKLINRIVTVGVKKSGSNKLDYLQGVLDAYYEWEKEIAEEQQLMRENNSCLYYFFDSKEHNIVMPNKNQGAVDATNSRERSLVNTLKTTIPISYCIFAAIWLCGAIITGMFLAIDSLRATVSVYVMIVAFLACIGLLLTAITAMFEWRKLIGKKREI